MSTAEMTKRIAGASPRLEARIAGLLYLLIFIAAAPAGLGYLTFLWPRRGSHLFFPWIVIPGVVGEGLLTLWLLVIGVNVQRWKQQANALRMGGPPE